jgi:radical SAM protein with 4Fe4S-binding SPASM domain
MANILLTEKCVRSCPYCFAKKHMEGSAISGLSWDNLLYIADFLDISGHRKVSLLGGEPTLHPLFVDFTTYLIARNFHVNVFTSGIMSAQKLKECRRYLSGLTLDRLSFTCNMNHPDLSTMKETEKIHAFLSAFGHLTTLGYNIYHTGFDFTFLIQLINEYNLVRHIRIGLAHPIPGEVNAYIPTEEIKDIARRFAGFFDLFERFGISPGFDCGMPMCIFTEEELGRLLKLNRGTVSFGCGPAIDIGPDMQVWSCFPLSNVHKRSLYEFNSMQEIDSFYKELHTKIRQERAGVFEDCDNCRYRLNDVCRGGCIAHSLNRFQNEPPVRLKDICS